MTLTYAHGTALVTGGSGAIGAAVVTAMVAAGLPVGFTYRRGREAATTLEQATRGATRAYLFSSSGQQDAVDLVERVSADLGPVRYLILCAGIGQDSAFFGLDEKEWRNLIDTNLTTAVALARAVITPLMKGGFGRLLFISSVSGLRGIAGHTVYAATKAGLDGLTRSLAQECARFGVTVNSIAPGYIDTPILRGGTDARRRQRLKKIPMGRLGTPDEVAHVVAFLAAEQAAYVTGQTWVVDGGVSL